MSNTTRVKINKFLKSLIHNFLMLQKIFYRIACKDNCDFSQLSSFMHFVGQLPIKLFCLRLEQNMKTKWNKIVSFEHKKAWNLVLHAIY